MRFRNKFPVILGITFISISCQKNTSNTEYLIKLSNIEEIRSQILNYKENHPIIEHHKGWALSKSRDPNAIIEFFPGLKLSSEYTLGMYQWLDSLGGFAAIYALPANGNLPSPGVNSAVSNPNPSVMAPDLLAGNPAPKLGDSRFSFMRGITGNDSAESYFLASILMFELQEFGAVWHGFSWTDEFILEGKPEDHRYLIHGIIKPTKSGKDFKKQIDRHDNTVPYPIQWNYTHPWPKYWYPFVTLSNEKAEVTFVTYSAKNECRLIINKIEFKRGSYTPITISSERLAKSDSHYFQY